MKIFNFNNFFFTTNTRVLKLVNKKENKLGPGVVIIMKRKSQTSIQRFTLFFF